MMRKQVRKRGRQAGIMIRERKGRNEKLHDEKAAEKEMNVG